MNRILAMALVASILAVLFPGAATGTGAEPLAAALAQISPHVAEGLERDQLRTMVARHGREQISAANRASSAAWAGIRSLEDWQKFRQEKLQALRETMRLTARVPLTREFDTEPIDGEGFQIQNHVYESRPGFYVTANLYVPNPPRKQMPGILISHSHHNPKHEGELQDMGMTWARAGCYVLVPDHLGHGERRQHPFVTAADYDGAFQLGRQDYYFRYDTSLQLYLAGECLMGWLVNDLLAGVDLLLDLSGVDAKKIILLGSVAGGGDPAAVAAALDERITCAVPFNFGGPQPESRYPLPADAETTFNYAGGGSWESTRNLCYSARDGFLPWVIVGSLAPRYLIHAHEFSWDGDRDPAWKRYETIWSFYGARERLAFAHGHGTLTGQDPPGSHCNNIGAVHRRQIHAAFKTWFGIDVKPEDEYRARRSPEELACAGDGKRALPLKAEHRILAQQVRKELADRRREVEHVESSVRRRRAREHMSYLLDHVDPPRDIKVRPGEPPREETGDLTIRRELLDVESGITVPLMVISPPKGDAAQRAPLVVFVAADGIAGTLRRLSKELAERLAAGQGVALVEVRGTGASSPGDDHGQQGAITASSATHLMLGQPLLAGQLRDLQAAWRHLAAGQQFDRAKMSIVGDSPVEPLPAAAKFAYPRRISGRPPECLPQGALLALLLALFEEDVASIECRGGLSSFESVLASPFVQVPHECIIPGLLKRIDLPDIVAALAPRQITLAKLVDGCGRAVTLDSARKDYETARQAYAAVNASDRFTVAD